ncbi:MAG: hypothetical protein ABSF83_07475 [Nitrososphaerales archaeon]
MSPLEAQRREAEGIVYRWFRFRVRRGLGVLYCFFSFLPVLGTILYALSGSLDVSLVGGTVAGVCASLVFRAAGFRGFSRMTSTMELLKGVDGRRGRLRSAVGFMVLVIWPWIACGISFVIGRTTLAEAFAVVWLVELVVYRLVVARRAGDPIAEPRVEDWLALFSFPLGALLSTIQSLPPVIHGYGFLLVSPLLLISGIKSLYDAPKELVVDHDTR